MFEPFHRQKLEGVLKMIQIQNCPLFVLISHQQLCPAFCLCSSIIVRECGYVCVKECGCICLGECVCVQSDKVRKFWYFAGYHSLGLKTPLSVSTRLYVGIFPSKSKTLVPDNVRVQLAFSSCPC